MLPPHGMDKVCVAALQVWNWAEVNEERHAAADEDGAAGDHYYGGAAEACDSDADAGLAEIIAEALNAGSGARVCPTCMGYTSVTPCVRVVVCLRRILAMCCEQL